MFRMIRYPLVLALSVAGILVVARGQAGEGHPWPVASLMEAPRVLSAYAYPEKQVAGVRDFIYESVPYRGTPTQIFAYYQALSGPPPQGG